MAQQGIAFMKIMKSSGKTDMARSSLWASNPVLKVEKDPMNGAALALLRAHQRFLTDPRAQPLFKLTYPTSYALAAKNHFPINICKWITGTREMKQKLPRVAFCVGGSSLVLWQQTSWTLAQSSEVWHSEPATCRQFWTVTFSKLHKIYTHNWVWNIENATLFPKTQTKSSFTLTGLTQLHRSRNIFSLGRKPISPRTSADLPQDFRVWIHTPTHAAKPKENKWYQWHCCSKAKFFNETITKTKLAGHWK